jgi:UDP-N-acetyl-D-galactosamine dehydrogenase
VAHDAYRELGDAELQSLLTPGGTLADLKGIWRDRSIEAAIDRWSL